MTTEDALELNTRRTIYTLVTRHAGLHFRELARRANLSVAVTKHHLAYLKKRGLIKEENDRRNLRYYPLTFGSTDIALMNALRHETRRKILLTLLIKKKASQHELLTTMDFAGSTLSEHLKALTGSGVVERSGSTYSVTDHEEAIKLLITYRQSFFDLLVERVIETWEF